MWFVLAGLVGLLASSVAAWLFYKTRRFLARAVSTEGHYVDATWSTSQPGGEMAQVGIIAFQTPDGRTIRFQGRLATPFESHKSGRVVRVLYDPAKPEEALVDSFIEIWMPIVIFGSVGMIWLLITLIGLLFWALGRG